MTDRIRTIATAAAVTMTAALSVIPGPAEASPSEHCVALGEFNHLRDGQTKRQVETNWAVRGFATWDADRSTPGYDAYNYPSCNEHYGFRVAFARHTREWVWQESSH